MDVFRPTELLRELAGADLHEALDESREQDFWVAYQPIVGPGGISDVRGAEALMRWQHPLHGVQVPSTFIPAMERTGKIRSIGEWVLREACAQASCWRKTNPSFEIHVNTSPLQLLDQGFVDAVATALDAADLPAEALSLEITENIFIGNAETMNSCLRGLADLGVRLFIDDFGTGFSSISYIRRMPFAGIKIDRSFIQGLGDDPRDRAMILWMVNLAEAFRLDVIAEGIETELEASTVCEQGVSKLQGFLYGRALPASEFSYRYASQLLAAGIT
jgi:EAL domain-containing protein (putative c-di-GMP-specific phosphodiesterase class I)